jgi:predicted dehydrogenase
MYGVGILGLGYWYGAYRLARALQEHDKARLVGVYDEQPEKTLKLVSVFGGKQAFSPEELIHRDDLDIVFIAAPSNKIPEYGIMAASANKHLIVGKPIAINLEEADKLVEAADRSKSKIVTMEVCDSAIITFIESNIISLITSGQIGQVVRLQSISHSSIAESWYCSGKPGWFADPNQSPGGAFIDYAIYDLEVLKYIAKAPVSQIHFARMGNLVHHDLPVEDWGISHFSFENGIEATMEASWTIVTPNITKPSPKVNSYSHYEIIGTKGRILFDLLPYEYVSVLTQKYPNWVYFRIVKSKTESEPPVFGPLEHLINCIENKQEPIAGLRDARDCLASIMEMYNKAML